MAADSYTEVTSQSWFSRIGGAFKGIFFGLVLLVIALGMLFWNEGRAVKRYKTLKEGGGAVISVTADQAGSAESEGRLVHVSGQAVTDGTLTDPEFGVSSQALKLRRRVEMFQWKESSKSEERKKLGGGTETTTTYSYERQWSSSPISSAGFKKPEGHTNPAEMAYRSREFVAEDVMVGSFRLPAGLIAEISSYSSFSPSPDSPLPAVAGRQVIRQSNGFYVGANPDIPKVGDLRIVYSQVLPAEVSIIARQSGTTFQPYQTTIGGTIELLQMGTVAADVMIAQAQKSNTIFAWVLRAVGFLLLFLGLRIILAPLSVFADVVPLFGKVVGAGTGLVSGLLAAVLWAGTVGIAWLFYRPLLGGIFLAAAAAVIVLVSRRLKKAEPPPLPNAGSAVPPPPPPGS
jgi:hypothetical protein